MKELLGRLKIRPQSSPRRGLFPRRRSAIPVTLEPESKKSKPIIPLEELLPLLPQLGGVIPQLKNPKVMESIKILANPAVIGMIQQFLANGGRQSLKGRIYTEVSSRTNRLRG